jgi:carbon-monoxide dehydrogenase medium subunit
MLVALRSRRQIDPFTMHRPASVAEALALHAEPGRNVFLAGGIELIDWLKYGHKVDRVIRLDGIPALAGISPGRVGAMATHAAIAAGDTPLSPLWPTVASPRVRFTGTIGGNVMCGKADYDGLPALMAAGAMAETASGATVALEDSTSEPLVTAFLLPEPVKLFCDRTLRPALTLWAGLTATTLRVGIGMAHARPVCVTVPLGLGNAADIAAEVSARLPEPVTDGRATAGYRRRMVGVLTRRILIRAGDRS